MDFKLRTDSWSLQVEYYDDSNPTRRIPRTIDLPITTTKPEAIQTIKSVGAEIKNKATLNTSNIIGTIVTI